MIEMMIFKAVAFAFIAFVIHLAVNFNKNGRGKK